MGQAGRGKALNLTIDRMSPRPKGRIGKCSGETIQVSGVVKQYVWELKSASMARPAGKNMGVWPVPHARGESEGARESPGRYENAM